MKSDYLHKHTTTPHFTSFTSEQNARTRTHTHTHTHARTHARTHAHKDIHTLTHTNTHIHTHARTHTHTHTHARTHARTHTHTHTHTRARTKTRARARTHSANAHNSTHARLSDPEEKLWVWRADLNDGYEKECRREYDRLFQSNGFIFIFSFEHFSRGSSPDKP